MSDLGRKDFSDKAQEKMTPDSQKSTGEKVKEGVTGGADSAARHAEPDSQKSTTQQMSDTVSGSGNSGSNQGESMMDKAKHAVGMDKQ